MNILLTGSNGLLGKAILYRLMELNYSITLLNRRRNDLSVPQIIGDLTDPATYKPLKKKKFDIIIHCAGYVPKSKGEDEITASKNGNEVATHMLLRNIDARHCIFASTCEVYGPQSANVITEDDTPYPISYYAQSKYHAEHICEKICAEKKIHLAILRFTTIISPHDPIKRAVPAFLDAAFKGETLQIKGTGLQKRDYIYINDAVEAITSCIQNFHPGIYNISGGTGVSISSAAKKIIKLTKSKSKIKYIHDDSPQRLIRSFVFSSSKFKKTFHFTPSFSIHSSLKDIVKNNQSIVFDLDGTLLNPNIRRYRLHAYLTKKHGFNPLHTREYIDIKRNGFTEEQIASKIGMNRKIFELYEKERMDLIESEKYLKLDTVKPHVIKLLHKLTKTHTLILLTKRKHKELCIQQLTRLGLLQFFSEIIIEPHGKLEALKKLKLSKRFKKIIIVGDTSDDLYAARRADIPVLLVCDGVKSRATLSQYKPKLLIDRIVNIGPYV